MLDILIQVGKMIGIFFFWYFTFYEIPKLLKDGTFHTLYDIIKYVTSQGEYNPSDRRSKTIISKIVLFIDKFVHQSMERTLDCFAKSCKLIGYLKPHLIV